MENGTEGWKREQVLDYLLLAHQIEVDGSAFVKVEPLPKSLKGFLKKSEFKACYNNAYKFMSDYAHVHDVQYVLGFGLSVIPVEHAWIKVDGVYYDPTWEKYSKIERDYVVVTELNQLELMLMTLKNNHTPPALYDLRRMKFSSSKKDGV